MQSLVLSTGVVALGEMGDKTQLLALLLAARFRRPLPIVAGIVAATLLNHTLAGVVGEWLAAVAGPTVLRWVVGLGFLAMAAWIMVPDKLDDDEALPAAAAARRFGVFMTTAIAFFVAEMGDKTQLATVALAARFQDLPMVVGGTTLGMLIADVPAVFVGHKMAARIPMKLVHGIAAAIFAVLGLLTLADVGQPFAHLGR